MVAGLIGTGTAALGGAHRGRRAPDQGAPLARGGWGRPVAGAVIGRRSGSSPHHWALALGGALVGLLAGAAVALVLAGPLSTGVGAGSPSLAAAVHLAITATWAAAVHGSVPIAATHRLDLGTALAATVVAVAAQLAAGSTGRVMWGLVPSTAAVVVCGWLGRGHDAGPLVLLFGTVALLALLVETPHRTAGWWTPVAAAVAVGAVLATVPQLGPGLLVGSANGSTSAGIVDVQPTADLATVKLHLSHVVVMTVRSPLPSYWQLTTLSHFTGTAWVPGHQLTPPHGAGPARRAVDTMVQHVHLEGLESPWLPAAPQPTAVRGVAGTRVDRATGDIPTANRPDDYTVVSAVPSLSAAELANLPAPARARWLAPDLALPPVPVAVTTLAHALVAGITSPYEQALALVRYFGSGRFRYTLSPPPVPVGANPLVAFLTVTRAGYCQQFAGAFAVLARLDGLPTRLAVGFATGTSIGHHTFEVRGSDAHVWPEVYLGPTAGWVSFEPTPAATGAVTAPGHATAHHTAVPLGSSSIARSDVPPVGVEGIGTAPTTLLHPAPRTPQPPAHHPSRATTGPRGGSLDGVLMAVGVGLGLVVLVGIGTVVGVDRARRRRARGPAPRLPRTGRWPAGLRWRRAPSPVDVIEDRWEAAVSAVARQHGPPRPPETPTAYARRVAATAAEERRGGPHRAEDLVATAHGALATMPPGAQVPPGDQAPYDHQAPPDGQAPYDHQAPPDGQAPYDHQAPPDGQAPYDPPPGHGAPADVPSRATPPIDTAALAALTALAELADRARFGPVEALTPEDAWHAAELADRAVPADGRRLSRLVAR
jgi:hypothetical protein